MPLVYSASLATGGAGDVAIGPQRVSSEQAAILVTPTQRYFTIQVSPGAIDWASASYSQVQVIVTPTQVSGNATAIGLNQPRTLTWIAPEHDSRFVTVPYNLAAPTDAAPTVTYTYEIIYTKSGSNPVSGGTQTATSPLLDIPAAMPHAPAARRRRASRRRP